MLMSSENVAVDIERFARHGSRTTVSTDDVLLMTRRNDGLEEIVREFVSELKAKKGQGKGKGRVRK